MNFKETRRGFFWKRAVRNGLLVVLGSLVVFLIAANWYYYSSPAVNLPCRGCAGMARSVQVGGFDLYYREVGSGEAAPVVLLHGGPGHSSMSFKGSFDFLSGQRRVIYYDQRGSGSSQIRPESGLYTIDQLVEELETLRRDVIQAEKIVVVGHSAGGALAQRYALAYPQHVERLVLVSSIRINNGVSAPVFFDRLLPALYLVSGMPAPNPDTRDAWFAQMNLITSTPRLYDAKNTMLLENAGYLSFATWRGVSHSLCGSDFREQLQRLTVPTLVMYGAADSDYSGEVTASELCGLLPRCTLARFDHSGHWPFLEEPERFEEVLEAFLIPNPIISQ